MNIIIIIQLKFIFLILKTQTIYIGCVPRILVVTSSFWHCKPPYSTTFLGEHLKVPFYTFPFLLYPKYILFTMVISPPSKLYYKYKHAAPCVSLVTTLTCKKNVFIYSQYIFIYIYIYIYICMCVYVTTTKVNYGN